MPLAGKPISRYRPYRQQPGWRASHAIIKPPLYQFVLLSMLVHALAITLFGAPSGGSREGRALWGSLQVVLQGAEPEPGPALRLDRSVDRLRAARPRREPAAPKARVEPTPHIEPTPPRIEPAPPRVEPAPTEAPPFSMPPLLDRIIKPDHRLEPRAPLKVPPPTAVQRPPAPIIPAPSPAAPQPPVAEERPAPRAARVPAAAPLVPAPL